MSNIEELVKVRHYLHSIPELSGMECKTASFVESHLKMLSPSILYNRVGGHGIVAVFDSGKSGKTLCFRADMDALPIDETTQINHKSKHHGISHKCGHDGHTTILLGFASWLATNTDQYSGKVVLVFQPAEETAEGALGILSDERFSQLHPDFIFGIHNLPGYEHGCIIIRDNVFAASTCGLNLKLKGQTSHAGHPEAGNSPLLSMIAVIQYLCALPHQKSTLDQAAMITITHANLGSKTYGTTPGEAEVMATFRTHDSTLMKVLMAEASKTIKNICNAYGIKHKLSWVERFEAVVNDHNAVSMVEKAASQLGMKVIKPEAPFSWSEDFSYYDRLSKCAFCGIGSGVNTPQLHNEDYDFPDEIIEPAVRLFSKIVSNNN